ncbi:MAG: phosphatidylserine/phosphatidylglycerophosphate/cardiolipin synthase family protein [Proteobacteria bacterium]|nr:phosphatidylserine/phosphatidylglycerophosphate/cardiolipin synthase family protein [Pseudomonadota bacterium]
MNLQTSAETMPLPSDACDHWVAGHRITFLHDGARCFPAMLSEIEAARQEILLEMYWFGSDSTGFRFAQALAAKAREGLRVNVLYDAVGSYDSSASVFDRMREAGCQVREFHPIAPWRKRFMLDRVYFRDHRKILVIDNRVALTGGLNLADEWAPVAEGGKGFRDDMVRVQGPAAQELRALFYRTWSMTGGLAPADAPAAHSRTKSPVRVLSNDFVHERWLIRRAYLRQIRAAKSCITLANSYFIPDKAVRRALGRAARRGVRVRVLVPGRSDVAAVQHASKRLYGTLLKRRIEVYEFTGSVLHAKSATIDDRWCTTGTFNFDHRSWRFSLEVNVAIEDRAAAAALRRRLERDIEVSRAVTLAAWRARPFGDRALQELFYALRRFL